jgi:uroporphyrinogen decarboxylase
MRQAGRYLPEYRALRSTAGSFLDLCYAPDKAAEATLQPIRRYGFDAAIVFSDILVVPHAFGQTVAFREGEGPSLTPLRSAEDIDALCHDGFLARLQPVFAAVRCVAGCLPPATALLGFAGAPWTVATYMIEGGGGSGSGFVASKTMAYGDPPLFQRLIDLLVAGTADYLVGQIDSGAEAVQLFDSWAGALGDEAFDRWVIGPTRAVVERVKSARPAVPVIGFPRGVGALYEAFAEQTGVDAVSLDSTVPLDWAIGRLGGRVTLQGNLDPVLVVVGGSALDRGIERIMAASRGQPFVFNTGHGLLPETPTEHVARLVERVRAWR